jgi:energy-converting hydrogenase Eha subunit A
LFEAVLSLISPNRLVFWWSIVYPQQMRNFGLQAVTIILKIQGLVLLQGRMGLAAGAISAAIHASGVAWDAA